MDRQRRRKVELQRKKRPEAEEFQVGDRVWVQDADSKKWDKCGVVARKVSPRSYTVDLGDGWQVRRNARFLKIKK